MPTYEYRCLDCRHQYEKREGFDAPALQECPTCSGTARRVIHATPIVFKGSGFYVTDSRPSAPEADAAASGEQASKADTPAAVTAEKPASTAADKPVAADKPAG